MRDRIAVIFMTLSAVATVALGGAVAHELSKPDQVTTTSAVRTQAPAVNAPTAGAPAAAQPGTASPAGRSVTVGGGRGSTARGGTAAGNISTKGEGVSRGLITVGGIYDETGPVDATVERDTVRALFNMVNAAGGVGGYKFQLVDCDSGFDPTAAHQCAQRLLNQGVLAIVGWTSPSGEDTETRYFNSQGVPVIGGLGVPSQFDVPLSWPSSASLELTGTVMGTHAKDLAIKAPGVVVVNLPFIKPVEKTLVEALHRNGIQEKSVDEVDATKPDYTDLVIKLRSENVDSIIAALDPFSYARLFQAMDRQNFHPKIFGFGLDKGNAQRQYKSTVYGAESLTPMLEALDHQSHPAIKEYLDAVRKYFPGQVEALDVYTEMQWVAGKVFLEGIRRIGDQQVTRKTLVDALNSIRNFSTGGFTVPLSYGPGTHEPNKCFQWLRNERGSWKTYSSWKCF